MTHMAQAQIKIAQISKDFNLKSKEVTDGFKDVGIEKKSGASADGDEFELFMEHLMTSHQIKDLESYLGGKNKIAAAKEKTAEAAPAKVAEPAPEAPAKVAPAPAAEKKPEAKPEAKPEVKPEAKPEVKPEAKPEVKKPVAEAKPQQPAAEQRRPADVKAGDRRPAQGGDRRDFNQGQRQGDRRDFNQGQRQGDRPQYQR